MTSQQLPAQVEEFLLARAALIAGERSLRTDHHLSFTPAELEADKVVRSIRQSEADTTWNSERNNFSHVFPGMEFLTARSVIARTRLFKILSKMPKGALLHCHMETMVDASYLINLALEQPAMHVRTQVNLTSDSISCALPEFKALFSQESSTCDNLTVESYVPDSWVPMHQARETFSPSLGGPEGFNDWVRRAMTIDATEAYVTHNNVTKIWKKFQSTFKVTAVQGLIQYEPIWRECLREIFRSCIEDGISYIEPRVSFSRRSMLAADGQEHTSHRHWLLTFDDILKETIDDMQAKNRHDEFIGARIIYTAFKTKNCEELEWFLEDCLSLKQEFHHLIAGYDLLGDEEQPLRTYLQPLLRFKERQKELGVDIPFIFHAGETVGDGTEGDYELYDAILLGTKRIGHGFSLAKHPKLLQICKDRQIAIEVCPISNEILRLTSSMPMHPLPILLNNGLAIVLGSDDPSVFGNTGLTYDFYQVLAASEITGLTTLRNMARHSLEYSTLDDADKDLAIVLWEKRWQIYVESITHIS